MIIALFFDISKKPRKTTTLSTVPSRRRGTSMRLGTSMRHKYGAEQSDSMVGSCLVVVEISKVEKKDVQD